MSAATRALSHDELERLARITGVFYLVVLVSAAFGAGYVRATLTVPATAAATTENMFAGENLFGIGSALDLIAFMADAAVAVLLFVLLRSVDQTVAFLAAVFRVLAHPVRAAVDLLNHFGVLVLFLSGGEGLSAIDPVQQEELGLMSVELHEFGYLIGGVLFGVHCALLGWLLLRSELFARWLGVLLLAAAGAYLTESVVSLAAPAWEGSASWLVFLTAGVAEVALCLWLLLEGVRDLPDAPG